MSSSSPHHRRSSSRVSFCPEAEVYFVESMDGSPRNIWYNAQEYDDFRIDNDHITNAMRMGTAGLTGVCTRGLEHKCNSSLTRSLRRAAISVVLDEQKRQRKSGKWNDDALAERYAERTESSQELARSFGLQDEQAACCSSPALLFGGESDAHHDDHDSLRSLDSDISSTKCATPSPVAKRSPSNSPNDSYPGTERLFQKVFRRRRWLSAGGSSSSVRQISME